MTREDFIKKAKEIHDNKYDYSKVDYINLTTKVCIICPKHGEFWQTPLAILYGKQDCPKCVGRNWDTEIFINESKKIHGEKYDYSESHFEKMHKKVKIICLEHGEFWQTPSKHINKKQGCPKCGIIKRGKNKTLTTEKFINMAKKKHGDKYDYSKVMYNNTYEKVCIICPKHGEFKQRANDHLNGHGCPKCNQSHLENEIYNFLKEKKLDFEEQKKFDWLGKQSLDFYLPKYNIAIECQGLQHFKPIKHFGNEIAFKHLQECDKRKKELCNEHNIKLLYYSDLGIEYPYEVFKNKEELLEKIYF